MSELYSQAVVDEVLARTDLRSVVEAYVPLQRRGGRFFGRCPFHDEKTPSFSVSPEQGLFYCFGCQAGGDALKFLMRVEGWSFPEALRELARRAGVRLPERSEQGADEARARRSRRDAYTSLLDLAASYYEAELLSGRHQKATAYLKERGVDEATRAAFRLGYAPPGWDGVLRALEGKKVRPEAVGEAGLALPSKRGGFYDRFRDRVMFPVTDRMGRVVGFSGRTLDPNERAKYVNSPELAFFKKGEHLFGLQAAKAHVTREREVLLVEGNFDVVTLHNAGFRTALAPLGTALTEDQVRLLTRLCDRVVIAFDGDDAGRRAMLKALGPCYAAGLAVRAVQLPDGSDPDSFVREMGAEAFKERVERARPLAEVALDAAVAPAAGRSPEERVRAARAAGKVLGLLPKGAVRQRYREEVARRLELALADVPLTGDEAGRNRSASRRGPSATAIADDEPPHPGAQTRPAGAGVAAVATRTGLSERERMLVQMLVDAPQLAGQLVKAPQPLAALRPELREFVEKLAAVSTLDAPRPLESLVDELEAGLRGGVLEAIAAEREYEAASEPACAKLVWQLHADYLHREVTKTRELLRAAEREGDEVRANELRMRSLWLAKAKADLGHHPPR